MYFKLCVWQLKYKIKYLRENSQINYWNSPVISVLIMTLVKSFHYLICSLCHALVVVLKWIAGLTCGRESKEAGLLSAAKVQVLKIINNKPNE